MVNVYLFVSAAAAPILAEGQEGYPWWAWVLALLMIALFFLMLWFCAGPGKKKEEPPAEPIKKSVETPVLDAQAPVEPEVKAETPTVTEAAVEVPAVPEVAVEAPSMPDVKLEAPAVPEVAVEAPSMPDVKLEAPAVPEVTAAAPTTVEVKTEATAEVDVPPAAPVKRSSKPDDLEIVEGIGPKIARILREAGITSFKELSQTEVSRLEEILKAASIRLADPGTWPEQARLAAEGQWDALQTYQDSLKGGRKA